VISILEITEFSSSSPVSKMFWCEPDALSDDPTLDGNLALFSRVEEKGGRFAREVRITHDRSLGHEFVFKRTIFSVCKKEGLVEPPILWGRMLTKPSSAIPLASLRIIEIF